MACVTACPSGVQYDKLIEATRQQVERRHRRAAAGPGAAGGDLRALPVPAAAAAAARAAAGVPGHRAAAGWSAGPACCPGWRPPWPRWSRWRPGCGRPPRPPQRVAGVRRRGGPSVGMLTGCVQGAFFPDVNAATARVLAAEGCDVVDPARPAGLLRRAERAQRARGGGAARSPGGWSTPSPTPGSTTSWSTRPAAARPSRSTATCCADDPRVRRTGRRRSPPRSATSPSCWSSSARSPPGTRCR